MIKMVPVILLFISAIHLSNGFKAGAPPLSCKTMTPGHGVAPQTSPAPYSITIVQTDPDGSTRARISATASNFFTGFLLTTKSQSPESPGTFIAVPDDSAIMNCGQDKDAAVTHRSNSKKQSVEVDWKPLAGFEGSVTFIGTVVYNYSVFWTGVESLPVQIGKRSVPNSPNGNDLVSFPNSPARNDQGLNAAQFSTYNGCGTSKTCLSYPDNCIAFKSCNGLVAVSPDSNSFQIEMFAKNSKYVAVGFSEDRLMGEDIVYECVEEGNNVYPYRSWNAPNLKRNNRLDPRIYGDSGISLTSSLIADGYIYCKIRIDPVTNIQNKRFDLNNNEYYLLLASGREANPNGVDYHDEIYTSSKSRRSLSEVLPDTVPDSFYDGCDTTKTCFGVPDGCLDKKNCNAVTSVNVQGNRYVFSMSAKNAAYVATALSEDKLMGEDVVFECAQEDNIIRPYVSWNVPNDKRNYRVRQNFLTLLSGSSVDGKVQCTVMLNNPIINIEGKTFDLANNKYVLLVASGSSIKQPGINGRLGYHDLEKAAAIERRSLADVAALRATSHLFMNLHGTFMIVSWIGLASLGIVLARYYKSTWVESSVCGKDVWFAWHRTFMFLAFLLTIAGVVLIYLEVGGISGGDAWSHALLGIITVALTIFQPLSAFFRPHPDSSRRPIFNWLHWFVGNAAHIIAIVTIFLAVDLSKVQLPRWTDYILAAYVAFYVFIHLILSIGGCMSEKSGGMRVNAMQMKDMNTGRNIPHQFETRKDASYSGFRKCIFTLYFLIIVAITALLVVLVFFSSMFEDSK
ncbi:putative ferric-chelate reductase 1 homolog [Planococcus citri]|uniref:putative ferric-chelate reductase 1 homolog n=1 Tax=Planococcus citri TaxID=170843 RepID=UPI0031F90BCF